MSKHSNSKKRKKNKASTNTSAKNTSAPETLQGQPSADTFPSQNDAESTPASTVTPAPEETPETDTLPAEIETADEKNADLSHVSPAAPELLDAESSAAPADAQTQNTADSSASTKGENTTASTENEKKKPFRFPAVSQKPLLFRGLIAAVAVLLGYGILCFAVMGGDKVFPNVCLSGLPVGSMTQEETEKALSAALKGDLSRTDYTLNYETFHHSFSSQDITASPEYSVQRALSYGRTNFLSSGATYLSCLLGHKENLPLSFSLTPRGEGKLKDFLLATEKGANLSPTPPSWQIDNETLRLTKATTGLEFDFLRVKTHVEDGFGVCYQNYFDGRAEAFSSEIDLTYTTQVAAADFSLAQLHGEIYSLPQNAEFSKETATVTAHTDGIDFDPVSAQSQYDNAKQGETIEIPLSVIKAEITKESLDELIFRDVLAQQTSKVGGAGTARASNIKVAADTCNQTILLPGEEFSYNTLLDTPEVERQFRPAPAYVGGKTVDELGGGICQVSSTIYYAVLHTELEVVERKRHMFAVGYVPDGCDATVYFGVLDFRFRNNTDYPIKIETNYFFKGNVPYLTATIHGTKTDETTIKIQSTSFDYKSDPIEYIVDPDLPVGKEVEEQGPYSGRKAYITRYFYDKDGQLIKTEQLPTDQYRSRPRIIRHNPAGDTSAPTTTDEIIPVPDIEQESPTHETP